MFNIFIDHEKKITSFPLFDNPSFLTHICLYVYIHIYINICIKWNVTECPVTNVNFYFQFFQSNYTEGTKEVEISGLCYLSLVIYLSYIQLLIIELYMDQDVKVRLDQGET